MSNKCSHVYKKSYEEGEKFVRPKCRSSKCFSPKRSDLKDPNEPLSAATKSEKQVAAINYYKVPEEFWQIREVGEAISSIQGCSQGFSLRNGLIRARS
jgi:hypothetical protein